MNSLTASKFKSVEFDDIQLEMITETILLNDDTNEILRLIKDHSSIINDKNEGITRKELQEVVNLKQYTFEAAVTLLLGATLIYQLQSGQGGRVIYQLTLRGAQVIGYMVNNDLI